MSSARLIIVSAPSGTGKTSLNTHVQQRNQASIEMVRSYTTRPARHGSSVEKDYLHVTRQKFQQMCDAGDFIEWAEVFGNLYGTAHHEVERITRVDKIALLEIDVQGGKQIKAKFPSSTAVFILPPTMMELCRRLTRRGTDSEAEQRKRLHAACAEIRSGRSYDCFIVNADFKRSCAELEAIVLRQGNPQLTREQGVAWCDRLLEEFQQQDWLSEVG